MDTFMADRRLLNPKFEGYKLDPIDQNQISRFPLVHTISQSTAPSRSLLSFHEVQSRITHNHLAVSQDNDAVYVDEELNVVSISVSDDFLPTFNVVYELPKPIQSGNLDIHPEYPSSLFLSKDVLAVSDGVGSMYLLHKQEGSYELLRAYSSPLSSPFVIHSGALVSEASATVVFSSRNYDPSPTPKKKGTPPTFDLWAARLDLSRSNPDFIQPLEVLWRRQGEETPLFAAYDSQNHSFFAISGSVYRDNDRQDTAPSYTPSPDEIAPIPRANENLDENKRPPPYSWTQTSDSVTIAFPLPSDTQKSQIQVDLTSTTLSLSVTTTDGLNLPVPLPQYSKKLLWDRISPSTSYWTWDREAEHTFGILSLHLDKQNEGTKWMQVFQSAGTTPAADAAHDDIEVPETLDPSELWHIREALEKYTAALGGEDGMGLGKGVPSLADGELDDEIDGSVGRRVYLSWLGREDGTRPASAPRQETSFQLLSLPLPGTSPVSLVVKEGLDGAVYKLDSADNQTKWVHTSTFSALAFVIASKRDIRFTYHTGDKVYALENGSSNNGGNVYIYRSVPRGEKWAKQAILRVADGSGGALLGVASINVQGKQVVLCLAERQFVLLPV